MRPWRLRLALRRSRVQWALLLVVLLVSVLASAMLSSLHLLSDASERFAIRAALTELPASESQLLYRIPGTITGPERVSVATEAATETFGDIPFTTEVQLESPYFAVLTPDTAFALSYLAYRDSIEEETTILRGTMPGVAVGETVPVAVPQSVAYSMNIGVGDVLAVRDLGNGMGFTRALVTGIYVVDDVLHPYWLTDRLDGLTVSNSIVVPGSGGRNSTNAFGPLLVQESVFEDRVPGTTYISQVPDFTNVSTDQLPAFIGRIAEAENALTQAAGVDARGATVVTTVTDRLGGVLGALAVTRASVLVTGLLLLVLAIAALSQVARLMGERRHGEQHLMRARGASSRELLRLGTIEAIVLGAITGALGPLLARQTYLFMAKQDALESAGLNKDPGIPLLTWAAGALVGLILVAVLTSPLMRRGTSFVESEQARARPGKKAAFQRSGLDLIVVVLAAVTYWQLRSYQSPVFSSGGAPRLDPVLAIGPAVALLAGALVAVRLIPAASRFLEALSARGRRAVMPLAAWEVGRRSARAVSAILLLTLAMAVGTFALTYLSTWRTSQDDQAAFIHVPGTMVTGLSSPTLEQRSVIEGEGVTNANPVFTTTAAVSSTPPERFRPDALENSREVTLIATTDAALHTFAGARLPEVGSRAVANELQSELASDTVGLMLPGRPTLISFDVTMWSSDGAPRLPEVVEGDETDVEKPATPDVATDDSEEPDPPRYPQATGVLKFGVEDSAGQVVTLVSDPIPVDGAKYSDTVLISASATGAELHPPFTVISMEVQWRIEGGEDDESEREDRLRLGVALADVSAANLAQVVPVPGIDPEMSEQAAFSDPGLEWFTRADSAVPIETSSFTDVFYIEAEVSPRVLLERPVSVGQTVIPVLESVPVVLTSVASDRLALDKGDIGFMSAGGSPVPIKVVGIVEKVPGAMNESMTVVANLDVLTYALVQRGAAPPEYDTWWLDATPEGVDALEMRLPSNARVTTQADTATALKEDSLRVASQAALWLVTAAAALLAAIGFAVHSVVTVRAREIEFAQLRAVGLQRRALARVVGSENLLLSVLGGVFGVAIGVALAYLVAPLVAVGPDGKPPIPTVNLVIPWREIALLALEVGAVLAISMLIIAVLLRRINPATMLRMGDER